MSDPATDRPRLFPARVDKVVRMYLPYICNEIRHGVIALQEVRVATHVSESCVLMPQLVKCTVSLEDTRYILYSTWRQC